MKGMLDYIHKKALKETYNAIFELEDDSAEKAKSLETPMSKEEIDDMRSRISAKCIDSDDINMMFLFIRKELENYKKKKELNERLLIIFNTLMIENYRKATNFILEEIFHIRHADDVIEKAFKELYDFTVAYLNDEEATIVVSDENKALYMEHRDVIFDTMSDNTFKTFMKITGIKII
jgi:hypothetical protein